MTQPPVPNPGAVPDPALQDDAPPPTLRRRLVFGTLAVTVVAMVTGGSILLGWRTWQSQPEFKQDFNTQRGQQLDVPLPDGSMLRLDTATRLEVRYFKGRRNVTLQDGQAMFLVKPDPQRPFEVLAGPLRATVDGGRFAMRHTPRMAGRDGVVVGVEDGAVRVELDVQQRMRNAGKMSGGGSTDPVQLAAGQQVASDAGGRLASVGTVPAAGVAPWHEHRVVFDGLRLDHALDELARYRPMPLVVRYPAVAALPVTGEFDPRDLAAFERALLAKLPVRLKAMDKGVSEIVAADR